MINISIMRHELSKCSIFRASRSECSDELSTWHTHRANLVLELTFSVSRMLLPNWTVTSTPQAAPEVFCHTDFGSPRCKVWSVECDGKFWAQGDVFHGRGHSLMRLFVAHAGGEIAAQHFWGGDGRPKRHSPIGAGRPGGARRPPKASRRWHPAPRAGATFAAIWCSG